MEGSLFKRVWDKYGFTIARRLWGSQVVSLKRAFDDYEQNKEIVIEDDFTALAFDLILCDVMEEERERAENEGINTDKGN